MTEQEIKLKVIEERVKKLEDRVNELALQQYETDISEEPYDWNQEPWVPTQGASQEMVEKAQAAHRVWQERQQLKLFDGVYKIN